MKLGQLVGKALLAAAFISTFAACATGQEPDKWTLWYIPNEPKPGLRLAQTCNTYVFASAPVPVAYDVAVVNGWTGSRKPQGNTATMHSGENFSGRLGLGTNTIHDESNGYDLAVTVVYKIGTYLAAKARADADCPPPAGRR